MRRRATLQLALILLMVSSLVPAKSASGTATEVVGNSWVTKAPMHQARGALGVAVVEGKIFAIGGSTVTTIMSSYRSGGVVSTNEVYDPSANIWTIKTPMPTPRANFATAVYQDKVYCFGGFTKVNTTWGYLEQGSTVNEVYDPAKDTWEAKSPMPTARSYLQANAVDGKIYLLGGRDNDALVEVYDPANDSWASMPPIPNADLFYGSANIGNTIYAFVGSENGTEGFKWMTKIYSVLTGNWSSRTSASIAPRIAVAATIGVMAPRRIYVMSGWSEMATGTDNPSSQPYGGDPAKGNQIYDPENDAWTTGVNRPTNREDFAIAVVNDKLYVIGGIFRFYPITFGWNLNNDTPSAANEEYTPAGYGTPDPSYLIEVTPPKINVLSPINQTYNQTSVPLWFVVDKPVNFTSYSLDGKENVTIIGNADVTELSGGLHNITFYAEDSFGNIGASETVSFTVAVSASFPFMEVAVVAVAVVVAASAGLVLYWKRRRQSRSDA